MYDPNHPAARGIGGVTARRIRSRHDIHLATTAANAIFPTVSNVLDGDDDGKPGGLFQFWFEPNDANTNGVSWTTPAAPPARASRFDHQTVPHAQ